jgi:hypothetical protein
MEAVKTFLTWLKKSGLVLIAGAALCCSSCSELKNYSESCQEASLETWTNEFIVRMKAGSLPDDANRIAESLSVSVLTQCMEQHQLSN